MKKLLISVLVMFATSVAIAKLPALSDEAKAKAAEAAAKSAWAGKVDNYLLCKSQDKVAVSYYKTAKTAGKDAAQGKLTYVAVHGLDAARREAERLEQEALAALAPLGAPANALRALGRFVVRRDH